MKNIINKFKRNVTHKKNWPSLKFISICFSLSFLISSITLLFVTISINYEDLSSIYEIMLFYNENIKAKPITNIKLLNYSNDN